jgi:hypothetical protein
VSTVCPHCDAKIVKYKHNLTPGLVSGLLVLHRTTRDPINLKELNLTRNQWDNFQKLRYWGFVAKVGGQKTGVWQITAAGINFCNGIGAVQKSVWTYRGSVTEYEGKLVTLKDITGEDGPHYQREFPTT